MHFTLSCSWIFWNCNKNRFAEIGRNISTLIDFIYYICDFSLFQNCLMQPPFQQRFHLVQPPCYSSFLRLHSLLMISKSWDHQHFSLCLASQFSSSLNSSSMYSVHRSSTSSLSINISPSFDFIHPALVQAPLLVNSFIFLCIEAEFLSCSISLHLSFSIYFFC